MSASEPLDPSQAPPSPEATVRLPMGLQGDPYTTMPLKVADILSLESTQQLKVGVPETAQDQTQKLSLPKLDPPPIRQQKVDAPVEAEGQTQPEAEGQPPVKGFGWKLPVAVGLLVVVAVATYLLLPRSPVSPAPVGSKSPSSPEQVPAEVQLYLDQAKAGDTHAMRTLGTWYYYGLNVPQDREKGLYWYRKAAEKGSDAARAELSKIEGGR